MESERFEVYQESDEPRSRGCLKGCLIVFLLMLVVVVIAGYWASQNWRDWVTDAVAAVLEQTMEAANLPAEERQNTRAELKRALDAFRAGELSARQVETLAMEFIQSPLMALFLVDAHYLNHSGLSEEEKAEGQMALRRLMRGIVDHKIEVEQVRDILSLVADRRADGGWEFKDRISDEQLSAMLAAAKDAADKADIPAEVERIRPSLEIRRIVDRVMGEERRLEAEPEIVEVE